MLLLSIPFDNFLQPIRNNSLLTGALDMGGGSAEIAFLYQEDSIPQEESFNVTLYGIDYSLYSHSYLCYGFNEARRQLLAHLVEVRFHYGLI